MGIPPGKTKLFIGSLFVEAVDPHLAYVEDVDSGPTKRSELTSYTRLGTHCGAWFFVVGYCLFLPGGLWKDTHQVD